MVHFSCDLCGKDLTPEGTRRFVLKMEAFAAPAPALLQEEDLQDDHVEDMARYLQALEAGLVQEPSPTPERKQMRFDLCSDCYRRFLQDPLRRDALPRFNFSSNN
ncbi:MAG: hypothetical protein WHU94_12610 [Thermogemmata sp.]